MPMSIELKGSEKFILKLSPTLLSEPLRKFLTRSAIIIQGNARENVNERAHDTGQLLNSILYEVDSATPPMQARIGHLGAGEGSTLWHKATSMEYGTGLLAEGPNAKGGRHFPPPSALQVWAVRHGFRDDPGGDIWHTAGGKVARRIGIRGGLRPRRYLRDALKSSVKAIESEFSKLGDTIRENWDK
jgi:hypothetical protein